MGDKLLLRLNIDGKPIANKYCEGKMKRTLKRGLKDLKSLRRNWYERINCHRSKRGDVSLVWATVRYWLSYTNWSLPWFRRQKAGWVQIYRNQCAKRRRFTFSSHSKRSTGLRDNALCDPAKMVRTDPSWNTDQGVYHICEFASGETHRHTERKCKMRTVTGAASTDLDLLRRVRVRAYLVGPERWWTMLE